MVFGRRRRSGDARREAHLTFIRTLSEGKLPALAFAEASEVYPSLTIEEAKEWTREHRRLEDRTREDDGGNEPREVAADLRAIRLRLVRGAGLEDVVAEFAHVPYDEVVSLYEEYLEVERQVSEVEARRHRRRVRERMIPPYHYRYRTWEKGGKRHSYLQVTTQELPVEEGEVVLLDVVGMDAYDEPERPELVAALIAAASRHGHRMLPSIEILNRDWKRVCSFTVSGQREVYAEARRRRKL